MTYKPVVCWQVPLHRTIEEQVANDGATLEVHTIAAFERGHWGEGGADFGWWCLEDAAAFVGDRPLYRSMERELREMVGDTVYDELAGFLDRRRKQRHRRLSVPPGRVSDARTCSPPDQSELESSRRPGRSSRVGDPTCSSSSSSAA
jgi:hypothetical protein